MKEPGRLWLVLIAGLLSAACAKGLVPPEEGVDDGDGGAGGGGVPSSSGTTSTSSSGSSACDNSGVCETCIDCAKAGPCAVVMNDCFNNQDCVDFFDCIQPCATEDTVCWDNCYSIHPTGSQLADTYAVCVVCGTCYNDCDGASSGCDD